MEIILCHVTRTDWLDAHNFSRLHRMEHIARCTCLLKMETKKTYSANEMSFVSSKWKEIPNLDGWFRGFFFCQVHLSNLVDCFPAIAVATWVVNVVFISVRLELLLAPHEGFRWGRIVGKPSPANSKPIAIENMLNEMTSTLVNPFCKSSNKRHVFQCSVWSVEKLIYSSKSYIWWIYSSMVRWDTCQSLRTLIHTTVRFVRLFGMWWTNHPSE